MVKMSPELALVSFSQNLCISIAAGKQSCVSFNNNNLKNETKSFFYYLLCLFHFYKNTKIQNTFTNIILHKKFMKLKEEKNIYIKLQIF